MLAAVKDEPGGGFAVLDRSCARQLCALAGRGGKMSPIEQKDFTEQIRVVAGRQQSGQPRPGAAGRKAVIADWQAERRVWSMRFQSFAGAISRSGD